MGHNCFVSFKKEDWKYKKEIIDKLGANRILGKSLDKKIESEDIDYVMQVIREEYMKGTTVTIFLIGEYSSENEGLDSEGRNNQAFIIRELQATLYDRIGNPRDGLLGVVLPEMESKIFGGKQICQHCGSTVSTINLNDDTVIREFSRNYWLKPNECGHYDESGRYAVLCRYSDFMQDPEKFIDKAFEKTKDTISQMVHFRDIEHIGL